MKLKHNIILLALLLCAAGSAARNDSRAAEYMRRLAAAMESMKAYTVDFRAEADGESIGGRYEVDADRYHITVAGNEVYGDDSVRREIDVRKREIVVDAADTTSRNLLTNPTRGFRFLGDDYQARLDSESGNSAVITLTPAAKSTAGIISVTLSISDSLPKKICYNTEGEIVTIVIESIGKGAEVPEFSATNYPDFEIIDFR